VEAGAHGVELDLRLAKDGEIVVVHDSNLHRVAGDARHVHELTAAQLCRVPLRHGGCIPTLQQVISSIQTPTVLDMEVKSKEVADHLIKKLRTSSALRRRTIVSSFHFSVIEQIQAACPDVRTLALITRWPLGTKKLIAQLKALQPWGIGLSIRYMNTRRLKFLRDLGAQVGTWDERGTAREARLAAKFGVDFAIVRHVPEIVALSS
jgi:glycerophosphoryl diester phosphodiesterase